MSQDVCAGRASLQPACRRQLCGLTDLGILRAVKAETAVLGAHHNPVQDMAALMGGYVDELSQVVITIRHCGCKAGNQKKKKRPPISSATMISPTSQEFWCYQ